jgi:hypothetical protein
MRIGDGHGISISRDFKREEPKQPAETTGTSLVPLDAAAAHESTRYRQPRTLATFVTQLIAKSQDAPHLRERRRADPAEAANAYGKILNLSGVPKRYKARPF